MSDYFIPRDYSLRAQDLIPEDDRPCAYRLPESVDDLECWSGNCTLAAAELERARQHLGMPFALVDEEPPPAPLCPHCGFVDGPDHRWPCRWTRLQRWCLGR